MYKPRSHCWPCLHGCTLAKAQAAEPKCRRVHTANPAAQLHPPPHNHTSLAVPPNWAVAQISRDCDPPKPNDSELRPGTYATPSPASNPLSAFGQTGNNHMHSRHPLCTESCLVAAPVCSKAPAKQGTLPSAQPETARTPHAHSATLLLAFAGCSVPSTTHTWGDDSQWHESLCVHGRSEPTINAGNQRQTTNQ